MTNSDPIQQAAALLKRSQNIAVLTGAGVSKESGVPTFRDALEGLWAKYDPAQLATVEAFRSNPKMVWDWYTYRREMVSHAQPNPGHRALAALEKHFPRLTIITQNVDDLHEQAGSSHIIHLHGNLAQSKCFDNCQGDPTLIDLRTVEYDLEQGPPACPHCGAWVRPNVVWFGEMLPHDALQAAYALCASADVLLVVGTSGLVSPASSLPGVTQQNGGKIIEVNPDYSMITRSADIKLEGPSGQMLPLLVEALNA